MIKPRYKFKVQSFLESSKPVIENFTKRIKTNTSLPLNDLNIFSFDVRHEVQLLSCWLMNLFMKENFLCLQQFQNCHPFEAPFHKRLVMHGSQLWRNGHRRESISASPAGDGRRDINRNCSKPLETRFEMLTKAQKSPDNDLGSNVFGLALRPLGVIFHEKWELMSES